MGREMYNAGLEAWRGGYRRWQHNPLRDRPGFSYFDNCKDLTGLRAADEAWAGLSVEVGRGVLARLDRSITRFYEGGGYPRFKGRARWRSIDVKEATTSMIQAPGEGGRWHRLRVKGLPELRFDASRMEGQLKQLRIVRAPVRLEVHAVCEVPDLQPAPSNGPRVGIDLGVRKFATLSDGTEIPARHWDRARLVRLQRRLARAERGSANRAKTRTAIAKEHARQRERRRQGDFRVAHQLVDRYGAIAVEDLRIANMMRSAKGTADSPGTGVAAKRALNDRIQQQGWGAFLDVLEYKAAQAGVELAKVNPAHTSRTCSNCGEHENYRLNSETFSCQSCGTGLDRDLNAARNICARAFGAGPGGRTPAGGAQQTSSTPVPDLPEQHPAAAAA